MGMSDLTDREVVILYDVLSEMRICYDKMLSAVRITQELTKEDLQPANEGLALFGKRMADFETDLQKVFTVKKEVDILVRSSQMNARLKRDVDKTFKDRIDKDKTK